MAKKQHRIKQSDLTATKNQWLGQSLSVIFQSGAVLEICPFSLENGQLLGRDSLGLRHKISLTDIKELILKLPVADAHAQTSAD